MRIKSGGGVLQSHWAVSNRTIYYRGVLCPMSFLRELRDIILLKRLVFREKNNRSTKDPG